MTKPITCPCEEFDRDLSTDRCYCGHAYEQHSEADDLVCAATEAYPRAPGCTLSGSQQPGRRISHGPVRFREHDPAFTPRAVWEQPTEPRSRGRCEA